MRHQARAVRTLFTVLALTLIACDGGEPASGSTPTPTEASASPATVTPSAVATTPATPTPRLPPFDNPSYLSWDGPPRAQPFVTSAPEPRRTGVPHLDAVLDVVEAGRADLLRDTLAIEVRECVAPAQAQGSLFLGPPVCAEDETPGTMVETFHIGQGCSGGYDRPTTEVIARWIQATRGLYAAVETRTDEVTLVFHGDPGVLIVSPFLTVEGDGSVTGMYMGGCASVEDRTQGNGKRLPLVAGPWLDAYGAPPVPKTGIEALDRVLAGIHRRSVDAWSAYLEDPYLLHSCWPFGLHGIGLFASPPSLHGVYQAPSSSPAGWEEARWWLAYDMHNEGVMGSARVGVTDEGRVLGIHYACDPAESIAEWDGQRLTPVPVREAEALRRSGIAQVDAILEEVEAGDDAALIARVRLYEVGCTRRVGPGGPPKCEGDDPEGAVYARLPGAACSHATWAESGANAVAGAVASPGLAAVLQGAPLWGSEYPDIVAEYWLEYHPATGSPEFLILGVADGAIISAVLRCGPASFNAERVVAGPWGVPD